MKKFLQLFCFSLILVGIKAVGQCVTPASVHSFVYDGRTYEIIKENKSWVDAAACAVQRGGHLAEINSVEEQEAVFDQIINLQLDPEDTKAPDGYSSYVWLGGNDIVEEGKWIWNGDNDASNIQFWQGTASGSAVGGLYNNWGNEPDNSASGTGQDALGLAIIDWPLGNAGQWNDVKHTNELYFVVEYNTLVLGVDTVEQSLTTLYPNPVSNLVFINSDREITGITIFNSIGQQVQTLSRTVDGAINLEKLEKGIYFLNLQFSEGTVLVKKIIKE